MGRVHDVKCKIQECACKVRDNEFLQTHKKAIIISAEALIGAIILAVIITKLVKNCNKR
jgi:hypothetical protein